ncbi:MAG: hypothetical protein ACRDFS_02885 [Chloroflexota bacterium]
MVNQNLKKVIISEPKIGILDLCDGEAREQLRTDAALLSGMFPHVHMGDVSAPSCDVLFMYARVGSAGEVVGSTRGLREIIRDSGAKIVVVATANPGEAYIKGGKPRPYGRANLVMTLDRRGEAFGRFFGELFREMKKGVTMPEAWVKLNPQGQNPNAPNNPDMIFVCEVGPLAFA